MEKGRGKGMDTLTRDNVFTRKEYIERELAIAETRKPRLTDAELRRRLANIPAADVVPVVRCKDCKYSAEARENDKGFLICVASGMDITDYDYCSYGERMDMGTDCTPVKDGDGE